MAIDGATLRTKLDAAVTAIAAGNWETAEDELLQAEGILAGLPDGSADGINTSWARDQIDRLYRRIRARRQAKEGLQFTNITYKRPGAPSC